MSINSKNYLAEFEEKHLSDKLGSTDEFMYSNARALDIYGQGKRFKIEDNQLFYEVVKIVKEIIDRHYYNQQVTLSVDIANKAVLFTFIVDSKDIKHSYFIETLYMFINIQLSRQYGGYFKILRDDYQADGKSVLKIKVEIADQEYQQQ